MWGIGSIDLFMAMVVGAIVGAALASFYYWPIINILKTELYATRAFVAQILQKFDFMVKRKNGDNGENQ